jgi:hypothetical protein
MKIGQQKAKELHPTFENVKASIVTSKAKKCASQNPPKLIYIM